MIHSRKPVQAEDVGLELISFADLSRQVRKTWLICARHVFQNLLTNPAVWRYLISRNNSNCTFILTVFRIFAAYHSGAMRFGLFVCRRPDQRFV